jgi:choline-glycine betaine transporter
MNETYLLIGLAVTVVVLIIIVISLVVTLKQDRARIRQSQKNHADDDKASRHYFRGAKRRRLA